MKVSWDGFARLIKVFQQNKVETASRSRQANGWIVDKHICQDSASLQKGSGSLRLREGDNDRCTFKTLGRNLEPLTPEEERLAQRLALIIDDNKGVPLPLLFRAHKKKEEDTENKHKEQESGGHILEFIIETEQLGVVIIRIIKQAGVYTGRVLVESGDAGRIIDQELSGLQEALAFVLQEKKINLHLLRWGTIPVLDLLEIKKELHKFSYLLDQKV